MHCLTIQIGFWLSPETIDMYSKCICGRVSINTLNDLNGPIIDNQLKS